MEDAGPGIKEGAARRAASDGNNDGPRKRRISMKTRFAKLCAMVLALTMVMTSLSGLTSALADDGLVDINVMVYDRGHEYTNGNSLTDNEFTRWVNSQMEPQGVHVNYVPVPRSGADDKINLMLTAGTAPDIIRTYDRQRVATYASQGGLLELSPYLEQLDPGYQEKAASVLHYMTFDGGLYALPGLYAYYGKSHETYLRQDLVEKMGMEMPATREELIAVLYAMKENFPDITPYGFSGKITNGNYTNWLLSYTSRADERTNYIYEPTFTIVLKPGHKEGLKQLNQFVLDGIIDPNFVLDTDGARFSQDLANGKLGFIMDGAADCVRSAYETVEDPDYHMVEVDCIENVDGNYDVPSQDPFSHYVYVPAASADRIDAIVKYLNFLSNEQNAIEVNMGMEGYGYDLVDGVYVERSRDKRIAAGTSSNPSDNCFLYSNFEYSRNMLLDKFKASNPNTPEDVAEGKIASQYSHYFDRCLIPAALETDEYVPLLQTLIVEFVFKVMCAPEGQFEEVYEKEYQILLDNHLQEVLDDRAAWYDANMK